ncbi:MAG TPA: SIMPL domain-containing protein [Candidatus Angelobacter sp.]|nr:SIMPL domain-containing protein [Candidatus Angelobacter sp.]
MIKALVFFLTILFAAYGALCQAVPAVQAPLNSIFAGADGKYEAAPDTVVLHFDIGAQDDASQGAYDKARSAAQRVRDVLAKNGIDVKAMQVGFYSVQPMYDWKNPKRKVIGYRVSTNLTLKLHDFSKIGGIIEQTADIDSMQNQSLNYTLEDIDPAKSKAAEDALHKARNQAGAVASAGGRTLGELLYASVDVNQQVIIAAPMMQRSAMAGTAAAPPAPTADFTPQSVTINAHVNALFALK